MTDPSPPTPDPAGRPRVSARFGLVVLEILQQQDAPGEVLEDENVSETMPRRLGLSDVVLRQVDFYRNEVRRRGRMSDDQVRDLMRLVIRRPDAEQVFWRAGRRMAGDDEVTQPSAIHRVMPQALAFAVARRKVRRGLRSLFGRRVGGFTAGPFAMEGRSLPFIEADPGGAACQFVSGYCQGILDRTLGAEIQIVHDQCESRGDECCRWTVTGDIRAAEGTTLAEATTSS